MNKKVLVFAIAAACLTSGAVSAQSYQDRNDSNARSEYRDRTDRTDRNGTVERNDHRQHSAQGDYSRNDGYRRDRNDRNDRNDRGYRNDGDNRYQRGNDNDHRMAQRYQMRRGEHLSHEYRDRRYVVSDWRGHRLHAPQQGYHWVQAGNDYALVAIATGLIAQVLLNH